MLFFFLAMFFGAAQAETPPNVVVLLVDDIGTEHLATYAEHPSNARTPVLDAFRDQGMLWRNFYAMPVCSPTRASLLTGRYSSRHGIGNYLGKDPWEMPLWEVSLPGMLAQSGEVWASAAVGKYHLTAPGMSGLKHPVLAGWPHQSGSMGNPRSFYRIRPNAGQFFNYRRWEKATNGEAALTTTYMTTDTADDAVAQLGKLQPPFVLYVAFNAPHVPRHDPPPELHDHARHTHKGGKMKERELYFAMIEALDRETGRVLAAVPDDTYVFWISDNGPPSEVIAPPRNKKHGKGTLYEGGTNVPMIVRGPGVPAGSETQSLGHVVDVFATIAELAGVDTIEDRAGDPVPIDGVSLLPVLSDPDAEVRDTVFTAFFKNGPGPYATKATALRNDRFKLMRTKAGEQLFDLQGRNDDGPNLLADPLSAEAEAAHDALKTELDHLTSEVFFQFDDARALQAESPTIEADPGIRRCFTTVFDDPEDLPRRVDLEFTHGRTGRLALKSLRPATFSGTPLQRCLTRAMDRMVLPPISKKRVGTYAYVLRE